VPTNSRRWIVAGVLRSAYFLARNDPRTFRSGKRRTFTRSLRFSARVYTTAANGRTRYVARTKDAAIGPLGLTTDSGAGSRRIAGIGFGIVGPVALDRNVRRGRPNTEYSFRFRTGFGRTTASAADPVYGADYAYIYIYSVGTVRPHFSFQTFPVIDSNRLSYGADGTGTVRSAAVSRGAVKRYIFRPSPRVRPFLATAEYRGRLSNARIFVVGPFPTRGGYRGRPDAYGYSSIREKRPLHAFNFTWITRNRHPDVIYSHLTTFTRVRFSFVRIERNRHRVRF